MSSKQELRARKDKAACVDPSSLLSSTSLTFLHSLMNTGRLMERRFDREQQEHQAEIQELQHKLEEALREATMSKGGGGALKELQKELAELRVTLAEAEAELVVAQGQRDAAAKERDDVLAGRPGAPQPVTRWQTERFKELEAEVRELRDKIAHADEEYVKVTTTSNDADNAVLAEKAEQLDAMAASMQGEMSRAVQAVADLKVKLAQVEELKTRESQRRTRQLKHAEERAERMREELITVWEASDRGQFSEAGKNKFVTKALDLEKALQTAQKRIVQLEDKGIEGNLVAAEKIAKRFYELVEFLRITEDEASRLVAEGVQWPAKTVGPQNLLELMAALGPAPPPPAPAPASAPAKPPAPKDEPRSTPAPVTAEELSKIKRLEATIETEKSKIAELEQSVTAKADKIVDLEGDRQRLEDDVAKQKSRIMLAERDAQERNEELVQMKGRKDKEATDLEKERSRLKHEVERQKRRAEDALAENKKIVAENSMQFAQLETDRDEAEASLARLVERQDRTKAEHEATMNQLVARIQLLESSGAGAASGKDAGSRALDKERGKNQSDIAFFRRQVEELMETARIKEKEHQRQMESKIAELELLEEERDRYRSEMATAREAVNKLEARVSKPIFRQASRPASPAPPGTPEKRNSRSESNAVRPDAELQQPKHAGVENLEKERAHLEAELATQTRIAEVALVDARARRLELEQLRAAKAGEAGNWEAERYRLEVELGSQATLALERARELDAERERTAGLVRQLGELEKDRNTLRADLGGRAAPSLHSRVVGAQLDGNVAPGASIDRPSSETPLSSLAHSFGAPSAPGAFGSLLTSPASVSGFATPPAGVSGPVRLLVEHLRKTNRELNQEVLALKDENMTMMMRLAGM
ncbi:hypothetical protein JCM3770_004121 [Rhodotorula araucariae]